MILTKRGGWPYTHPPNVPFEVNTQSPQARGLAAWWPFLGNQGATTPLRDRVGIYDLTFYNGPTWQNYAERGPALLFDDASTQYLQRTGTPITVPPLSFSFWMNTDANNLDQMAVQVFASAAATNYYAVWFENSGDVVSANTRGGEGSYFAQTTSSYTTNTWLHICAVFASYSHRAIYLNAGSKDTDTNTATPSGINSISVGKRGEYSTQYCSAAISDLRFYNRALSDAEVWDVYQNRWELYRPARRLWLVPPVTVTPSDIIPLAFRHYQNMRRN